MTSHISPPMKPAEPFAFIGGLMFRGLTVIIAVVFATLISATTSYASDWVRLGAVELGLDCLRRYLQGLPVTERTDFERV